MIGFVKGKVIAQFKSGRSTSDLVVWPYKDSDYGIAINILVTDITASKYPTEQEITVWTYHEMNDNRSYLIGLTTKKSMESFLSLLNVNGVGPKTALQIVDTLGEDQLTKAIVSKDITSIAKVPGIGQKTASKIILELSQNVSVDALVKEKDTTIYKKYETVIATLQKLGYSSIKAKEAVSKIKEELEKNPEMSVSDQVTLVLSKGVI